MANNTQTQLAKAIEMKGKVEDFSAILTYRINDLENDLNMAVRAGFPEDIADTYRERYFNPDRLIIDDLSKDMLQRHVDFLDRVIERLKRAGDQR